MRMHSAAIRVFSCVLCASVIGGLVAACGGAPSSDDAYESSEQAVVYCGGPNKVEGIDVSFWQGSNIDWSRVRASGKRFAFLRLSYGAQAGVDSTFRRNWTEAKANGVLRGAYQYFLPAQDTAAQANLVVRELGVLGPGDLPAVIDVEQTPNGVTAAAYAQKVADWIRIVEAGTGKKPVIYSGKYFWNDNVQSTAFGTSPLWLPAYTTGCPDTPRPWTKWTFWQYSDSGSVPGIPGNVDVNVFDGTLAQLEALAGISACIPSAEACNGVDDDCDGQSDEGDVCEEAFVERHAAVNATSTTTDVNGDGMADVCGRGSSGVFCKVRSAVGFAPGPATIPWSDAAGYDAPFTRGTLRVGDLNGDGRADFCIRHRSNGIECQASTPSGGWASVRGPAWTDANGWGASKYALTIRFADLDGDGRDDLCARAAKGLVCHLSTGAGFGPEIPGPAWSDAAGFDRARTWSTLAFADVDGDGFRDACLRAPSGVLCARFNGNAFEPPFAGPAWSDDAGWGELRYFASVRFADVDGDRKADACARGVNGMRCALATGAGFGAEVSMNWMKDADGWNLERYFSTLRVADVNGDEKADLCARAALGLRCYGFQGGAFVQVLAGTALADADGWSAANRYETIAFADVNGDGMDDPCARGDDGYACWPSAGASLGDPQRVVEFSDALGWDDATYYPSLRLGGPTSRRVVPNLDAGVGDAASPARDGDIAPARADGGGCGCTFARPRSRGSDAIAWIATLYVLVSRRRRKHDGA